MRALALALLVPAWAGAASCELEVIAFPDGPVLARTELPADGAFALRFTHSVTRRPVESRYAVRDGAIVQLAEEFDEHGPGLPSEPAGPGERWERRAAPEGAKFVLHMARPIERLVLRAHELPAHRLRAGGLDLGLARWAPRALELKPRCAR